MARVLVTYASKRGSTAEIAEAIAGELRAQGHEADCVSADAIGVVESYDAAVIGSAVYMKRWRGDARHVVRRHADELARMPFWVFSSGPVGDPDEPADPDWLEPPKIVEQVERLGAREHVVFGGRVPVEPRGPVERAMARDTPPEYRDRRDWDVIRTWAAGIAQALREPGSADPG